MRGNARPPIVAGEASRRARKKDSAAAAASATRTPTDLTTRPFLVSIALLLVGCPKPQPLQGCGKDTDCKGQRVCERGLCVDQASSVVHRGTVVGTQDGGPSPGDGGTSELPSGPPPQAM